MADNSILGTGEGSPSANVSSFPLPRVTIKFCTQCKWMLRAAYFAQELLSTFSTALGEVALQPSTGGVFIVEITAPASVATDTEESSGSSSSSTGGPTIQTEVLWDRKVDGGFPETKELKRRVRDVIQPERDLGHVDRDHARLGTGDKKVEAKSEEQQVKDEPKKEGVCIPEEGQRCEDCQ